MLTQIQYRGEELEKHRLHLEELVHHRTAELAKSYSSLRKSVEELRKARNDAQAANIAKSRFLANMSHEIRTPLNAILGFSDILKDSIQNEQLDEYLLNIETSGRYLLRLIDDILDMSKIEMGKLDVNYKPVGLALMFRDISGIFAQSVREKNLTFNIENEVPQSEHLLTDEARLRQILLNLVGNAIKFTNQGFVRLAAQIRPTIETSGSVDLVITVQDTGIGISANQKRKIFGAFEQQTGQDHAKYGGTGLGLAITKRLAEIMGGNVTVTSEVGKGSTFTVILENISTVNASDKQARNYDPGAIAVTFEPAKILIVDDMKPNRGVLKGYLKNDALTFIEAENGQEAIRLAVKHHPDLILMDIKMPVMDGIEASQTIRQNDQTKNIPIIAVTAFAMKSETADICSVCDGYISKPFNKNELIAEITRFLAHSKQNETADAQSLQSTEKIRPDSYDISPEMLQKLPELTARLQKDFIPRCEEINEFLIMDKVELFADELSRVAKAYGSQALSDYGERLHSREQHYDVIGVKKLLEEFPKLVDQMNQIK